MDLYLPFEKTIINRVLEIFTDIETHTGLTINYDKTSMYRLGSIANSDTQIYTQRKLHWTNDPINALGIELYKTKREMLANYENIFLKLEVVSAMWYYCHLTLIGKVLIANALMSSLYVYKLQVLPQIPDTVVNRLEKVLCQFIWNERKPKLPLDTLQREKHLGGLGLIDIRK